MSAPSSHDELVKQVRKHLNDWMGSVEERLRLPPTDPNFPSSVLLLAPIHGNTGSPLAWLKTINVTTPDHPDGWLHALQLSRDLLCLLAQLDTDFGLGIPRINELVIGHPLLRDLAVSLNGGRVVNELVEDRGTVGDDHG